METIRVSPIFFLPFCRSNIHNWIHSCHAGDSISSVWPWILYSCEQKRGPDPCIKTVGLPDPHSFPFPWTRTCLKSSFDHASKNGALGNDRGTCKEPEWPGRTESPSSLAWILQVKKKKKFLSFLSHCIIALQHFWDASFFHILISLKSIMPFAGRDH